MSEAVLREVILPAVFNKNGSKLVDCVFDKKYGAQDQFMSSVFFLTATVRREEDTVKVPLVVKFQPKDENVIKNLNTDVQFYNEVYMYSELLPSINKNNICQDIFPMFYYGVGTLVDPVKDVIIIEDLRPKGFRLTDEKAFIDFTHLKLAMEKLGRFHALSYVAKKENPVEFFNSVGKLKEPSWIESSVEWSSFTIRKCFHRALDPLIASGRHVEMLRRLLVRVATPKSLARFLQELVAAEEPVAVLCHGDFCRNNMLFSYDADGTPVDVRFFDVATARYSSPAVDITFFLLMNSSAAVRAAHWDQLLAHYHAALSSTATTLSQDVQVPSLQQLEQEVRSKAVYGFVHVSFFLPMMLWGGPVEVEEKEIAFGNSEEIGNYNASLGGEEGTRLMMSMVEELVDRGCLSLDNPFIKNIGE